MGVVSLINSGADINTMSRKLHVCCIISACHTCVRVTVIGVCVSLCLSGTVSLTTADKMKSTCQCINWCRYYYYISFFALHEELSCSPSDSIKCNL